MMRPVAALAVAGFVGWGMPLPAATPPTAAIAAPASAEAAIDAFYAGRGDAPLWLERKRPLPHAAALVDMIEEAAADGLDPADYDLAGLKAAVADSRRTDGATLRDDKRLSRALLRYLADLSPPAPGVRVHVVDAALAPRPPDPAAVLGALAAAASPVAELRRLRQHNPLYTELRAALARESRPERRAALRASLERLRAIPAAPGRRFVLVDTASAQLWMYADGRPAGRMKVVVGKPGMVTPLMAAFIRFVALRPYWNVPPDLVRQTYAPRAAREGWQTIVRQRFEVLDGWGEAPRRLDPRRVDWRAVADGRRDVRVRQLPGAGNMMGRMKFMFPNPLGIYLHDTPGRWAFAEGERRFSAGCVRLEDADALLAFVFGGAAPAMPKAARERAVDLPAPVPVYITYLTARPDGAGGIAYHPDVEGRDAPLLAALDPAARTALR